MLLISGNLHLTYILNFYVFGLKPYLLMVCIRWGFRRQSGLHDIFFLKDVFVVEDCFSVSSHSQNHFSLFRAIQVRLDHLLVWN
jgi:hypothetical protein